MMMGPEPMSRIFLRSVRFGMVLGTQRRQCISFHHIAARGFSKREQTSLRKRFAFGFRGEPDDDHAEEVDEAEQGEYFSLVPAVGPHQCLQMTELQDSDRGDDAAKIEAESLSRGANARREQLRQVQRQPAIKRSRDRAAQKTQQQKAVVEFNARLKDGG